MQKNPETVGLILLQAIKTWSQYFAAHLQPVPTPDLNAFAVDHEINDKVSLWQGDITELKIDAIVNAANESLLGGGGDGCIHKSAGPNLLEECRNLGGCPTGSAKITNGYDLPSKHVIHCVGPQEESPELLNKAYQSALSLVIENNIKSVAFPCISTGAYGYSQEQAAHVAIKNVRHFLEEHKEKVDRVIFAVFLDEDLKIYENLMPRYFPIQ